MTLPSSKKASHWSTTSTAVSLALAIIGLVLTVMTASPSQVGENLEAFLRFAVPTYLALATGGVAVLLVLNRRLRMEQVAGQPRNAVLATRDRSDRLRVEQLERSLSYATSIDAIGIANNALTSELGVEFYRNFLIHRRGRARFMFLTPGCESIRNREDAESRSEGALSMFVQHNLEDVARFISAFVGDNPKIATQIEVRLYDFTPALNAIIIDGNIAFVHYYGTHTRGYDAPTFIVTYDAPELLRFYQTEFESLWNLGTPHTLPPPPS